MEFECADCGKKTEHANALSFCPFCGAEYLKCDRKESKYSPPPETSSGRDVQSKYWEMTQRNLKAAVFQLHAYIVEEINDLPEESPHPSLQMERMRKTQSIQDFLRNLDTLLDGLNHPSAVAVEPALSSTQVQVLAGRIDSICSRLAGALGHPDIKDRQPQYTGLPTTGDGTDMAEDLPSEDRARLLGILTQSKHTLLRILHNHSLFSIQYAIDNLSRKKDALRNIDKEQLQKDLNRLAKLDYDPIFGEQPEAFLTAYWQGLSMLVGLVQIPREKTMDLDEDQDQSTSSEQMLNEHLLRWYELLEMLLDETYGAQTLNMIHVYTETGSILRELELMNA